MEPTLDALPADLTTETTLPFGLVVGFTAVISALLTASLITILHPAGPGRWNEEALERRARFEALDELRELTLERQRLEGLERAARGADRRLDEEWGYLGNAASRLVEHQQLAIDRALALDGRLETLAERSRELLADDGAVPADLRPDVTRMARQAEGYSQILRREISRLEAQRDTILRQIERAELDHRQITLEGVEVRVVHDLRRAEDAAEVAASIRRAGAQVELYLTPMVDTARYKGRLYYRDVLEEAAARRIARLAETVELIEIEAVGLANPFLSLWIVGSTAPGLDEDSATAVQPNVEDPATTGL